MYVTIGVILVAENSKEAEAEGGLVMSELVGDDKPFEYFYHQDPEAYALNSTAGASVVEKLWGAQAKDRGSHLSYARKALTQMSDEDLIVGHPDADMALYHMERAGSSRGSSVALYRAEGDEPFGLRTRAELNEAIDDAKQEATSQEQTAWIVTAEVHV